jgi:2-iminoacetate synthase ThiH
MSTQALEVFSRMLAPLKRYCPSQRMLQRAVVPPRTITKVSKTLQMARIILKIFISTIAS